MYFVGFDIGVVNFAYAVVEQTTEESDLGGFDACIRDWKVQGIGGKRTSVTQNIDNALGVCVDLVTRYNIDQVVIELQPHGRRNVSIMHSMRVFFTTIGIPVSLQPATCTYAIASAYGLPSVTDNKPHKYYTKKKGAVGTVYDILVNPTWLDFLRNQKKKDDLCDALLHVLWKIQDL
jgi:hypothetical protein